MCGLVGVAGDLDKKSIEAFNTLLIWNQVRGSHSTGVGSIRKANGGGGVLRSVGPPCFLMDSKQYDEFVNPSMKVIIGHGRHRTVGEVSPSNAHPFNTGDVIGAHNGTLDWWSQKHLDDRGEFGTDSEALINAISQRGAEAVIPEIDGAWALTWYDKRTGRLNMLRNDKRPLNIAFSKDRKTMFWASELIMLEAALQRAGIEYDGEGYVKIDQLWSWAIPGDGKVIQPRTERSVSGKKPKPVVIGNDSSTSSVKHPQVEEDWDDDLPFDLTKSGSFAEKDESLRAKLPALPKDSPEDRAKKVLDGQNIEGWSQEDQDAFDKLFDKKPDQYINRPVITPAERARVHKILRYRLDQELSDEDYWFYVRSDMTRLGRKLKVSVLSRQQYLDEVAKEAKALQSLNETVGNVRRFPLYRNFKGKVILRPEFEKQVKHGCSMCDGPIRWGDPMEFLTEADFDVVCGNCLNSDDSNLKNWLMKHKKVK